MADGCHTHEVSLGIKQNTEVVMRAAIAGLGTAESAVGMKKLAVDGADNTLQTADAAGQTTLNNCKLRLQQKLGNRWNASWAPTGSRSSTGIPRTQDQRLTLLGDLQTYFTAMLARESLNIPANPTRRSRWRRRR